LRKTTLTERALFTLSGLLLVFPSLIEGILEAIVSRDLDYTEFFGLALGIALLVKQRMRQDAPSPAAS
jgi:hypothetical protein